MFSIGCPNQIAMESPKVLKEELQLQDQHSAQLIGWVHRLDMSWHRKSISTQRKGNCRASTVHGWFDGRIGWMRKALFTLVNLLSCMSPCCA